VPIPAGAVRELRFRSNAPPIVLGETALRGLLGQYVEEGTLWIVNDGTRPTPTRRLFEAVRPECDVLVATGAHAAPTEEELTFILGPRRERPRVHIHNAHRSSCQSIGMTSRGTPVHLNSRLFDYDRILVIGSVEPHYFAGYTGGRKGLLPGVAAYRTIEANHRLYFEPGADILRLDGNPVHEDMVEAVQMLDLDVRCVNTVVAGDGTLVAALFGDLHETLSQAASVAWDCFTAPFHRPADLVIACVPFPTDADLYQSQKALLNATRACTPGGTIVLVSACRNGIGPRAFYDLILARGGVQEAAAYAEDHYRLGFHKAASFAEILRRHDVKAITDLPVEALEPLGIEAWIPADLKRAIASVHGRGGSIVSMPEASVTVPVPESCKE
jgi:nickel-dependent lactate racemase